ncbi:zinc knuckle CX2CX4HX4C containing protein [Tanacetum coccineum]
MAFLVVEYYARNNWVKHGLKRIMMNSKGFFFFKFDSWAGLKAILEGGPWLIHKSQIFLKKWSMDTRLLKEELTRIPIWVKLHDVPIQVFEEDEADLVDVVTIGIPSLSWDDVTKETIRVEYEWRPPRCDICKIFSHIHDHFLKNMVSPPIVTTFNVVTPTIEKTNDGFQTVGKKKKRKGKSKSTNGGQFIGPSVKQNVRYKPKATTSAPKKGVTNLGNTSQSASMLKTTGYSFKKNNLSMSNSFSALNDEEKDDEEDVQNVYDESANLLQNTKAGGSSTFTATAGERMVLPDNLLGYPNNVLDNQIFDTASDDSHPSNVEIYLNDEEDDGDNMIIPQTPSEEIRTRIDDEVYFLFGRHLDELHVTWAHLEKKRTRLRTNTKTLEDLCS